MTTLLAQARAADALTKVKELKGKGSGKYVSYVSSLPASILTNGLGQAMAQLLAQAKGKKDDAHAILYGHVQSWLCEQRKLFGDEPELLSGIAKHDQECYLLAQAEAMAYLEWLKKFARAFLDESNSQPQGKA